MKFLPKNSTFLTHFAWYFSGALIPLIINFIKTPIFTRHYAPEDFGVLGLVMISFGYLATLSFSWIKSCLWRFYPKYKLRQQLPQLYSNLIFIYILSSLTLLVLSSVALLFFEKSTLTYQLIVLTAIHFILHELISLYFVIIRLKGKAKQYNIWTSIQVVLSFFLLLVLAFWAEFDISAMLWCYILIDIIFLIYFAFKSFRKTAPYFIHWKLIRKKELQMLINFGSISLLASFFLMLIVSSDRYIIALYEPMTHVGIYSKTYDVAQMGILAIVFVFFNAVNPSMNKVLEEDPNKGKQVLHKYIYAFTFLFLPIVFIASIFRREITEILLGEAFQSGYILMPYIFFSMLIFGIITFYENEYKFTQRLKQIAVYYAVGVILNITLNFILIPKYGMLWAAITTLLSYAIILGLFIINDTSKGNLRNWKKNKILFMLFVLILFSILDTVLRGNFTITLIEGLVEAFVFVTILVLLFWRDVKKLEIPILH